VLATQLAVDVTARSATATITIAGGDAGATLEVGDLAIESVTVAGQPLAFAATADRKLDLALPAGDAATEIVFAYHYQPHEAFDGAAAAGFTFTWPYFCGNVFPCHSDPDDGTTFALAVSGVPAGQTAVFPAAIATEAPAYQAAWSVDEYTELPLGTTTAGTQVSMWHRPGEAAKAAGGGANLVAVFDWYEQHLGPYRFGTKVGTVSVNWPAGGFGGMEHHPNWHIASASLRSEETNAHEAAHGWFGDGIRIACWEDFVLSEGTVTYLAGRALEVVAPTIGAQTWDTYARDLTAINGRDPVWPEGCNAIDIIEDNLFTNAPYLRGAFFYRGLALKLGADAIDEVLRTFYSEHAGKPAHMQDMLDTIQTVTGYDATAWATSWLRSPTRPAPGPCP
jgi:Peptidase family M1 domain